MDVAEKMLVSNAAGRRSVSVMLIALATLACASSGRSTVGIAISTSSNPNAHFVCTPNAELAQMSCASGEAFHTADRPFDLTLQIKEQCEFGLAKIWIESDRDGGVTRVQFQCAAAPIEEPLIDGLPVEGLPIEELPAEPPAASGTGETAAVPQP